MCVDSRGAQTSRGVNNVGFEELSKELSIGVIDWNLKTTIFGRILCAPENERKFYRYFDMIDLGFYIQ